MGAVYAIMEEGASCWCQVVVVSPTGARLAELPLAGPGRPDASAVDAVARLTLVVRRLGADVVIEDASVEMRELLWLAALPLEVQRQAEGGKEPLGVQGVQEEAERGDLAP